MHRFWDSVTRPVLEAVGAQTVVEVGSDRGYGTKILLEWAKKANAEVHVVDPNPKYDIDEWLRTYGDRYIPHVKISHEALPEIQAPDVVLIDGDHNWYTVLHELRLLDHGREAFPVVLLHDVAWPYGERDLYYSPLSIPEACRQPYRRGGLLPGRSSLLEDEGINRHLDNAIEEGGPRNGVLTAVRDFVAESPRQLKVETWPGIHGLALVYEATSPQALHALVDSIRLTGETRPILEAVERDRLAILVRLAKVEKSLVETGAALKSARSGRIESEGKFRDLATTLRTRIEQMQGELLKVNEARTAERKQMIEMRTLAVEAQARADELQKVDSLRSEDRDRLRRESEQYEQQMRELKVRLESLRQRRSVRAALRLAGSYAIVRKSLKLQSRPTGPSTSASDRKGSSTANPQSTSREPREVERRAATSSGATDERFRSPDTVRTGADVVVCVHNAPDEVDACLASIHRHSNLFVNRVIIVDDGSDSETQAVIRRHAVELSATVLRSEVATGYTRAANRGLRSSDAPYVVLLNSDTVVTPGWIERLIACAAHRPDVGVVGPWSNAASWQSIPELTDGSGAWRVNDLPSAGLDSYAGRLAASSPRIYPEVALVNGFCYVVTRQALDAVGLLDEDSFPRGYGEEDDFSLRCRAAGLHNFIADDCYVFHSKSKSYGSTKRGEIVKESKASLTAKHGSSTLSASLRQLATDPDVVKARTYAALLANRQTDSIPKEGIQHLLGSRIGWVSPHLGVVGGVRRKLSATNQMAAWGLDVTLISPDGVTPRWMPVTANVIGYDEASEENFDVLIVSDPDVWSAQENMSADARIVFHLAAYHLYRSPSDDLDAFYSKSTGLPHLANSRWTQEQALSRNPNLRFAAIVPGAVDRQLFHPRRARRRWDVVCYGSTRTIKGTTDIEAATRGLHLLKMTDSGAKQMDLASLVAAGQVFVSAARHEGFNLPPLEAMACGAPVVMTDDGGSRDYAIDGENATVVSVGDIDALRFGIDELRLEPALAAQRVSAGMQTAWGYTWERSTAMLVDGISSILSEAKHRPRT